MKNVAIITSAAATALVGWLIVMPHSYSPESVEGSSPSEQASQPIPTPQISPPTTKKPTTPGTTITPKPRPAPTSSTPVDTTKYYTAAEVSTHTSTQSCWSIINGKVYDLTSWINRHPGGASAIKKLCGVDGSEDFNEQHGGESRPERELASFFIGVLK